MSAILSRIRYTQQVKAAACGLALISLLAGCSHEQPEEKKDTVVTKGVVEQASDAVAEKAAGQMLKPLDKAHDAQALQNAQNQQMQETVQEKPQQ